MMHEILARMRNIWSGSRTSKMQIWKIINISREMV